LESDAKLLENRIRLLEFEDKKAQKKIQETIKETERLKQIRSRNQSIEQERRKVF
jgi:intein/homing endonuclease